MEPLCTHFSSSKLSHYLCRQHTFTVASGLHSTHRSLHLSVNRVLYNSTDAVSSSSSMLRHITPVLHCRASSDEHLCEASRVRRDASPGHALSETVVGICWWRAIEPYVVSNSIPAGIKVIVLDPLEKCPTSSISNCHIVGSNDEVLLSKNSQRFRCRVLTVEIEHVDVATLEKLEQRGVDCHPKASSLGIIQDK